MPGHKSLALLRTIFCDSQSRTIATGKKEPAPRLTGLMGLQSAEECFSNLSVMC